MFPKVISANIPYEELTNHLLLRFDLIQEDEYLHRLIGHEKGRRPHTRAVVPKIR